MPGRRTLPIERHVRARHAAPQAAEHIGHDDQRRNKDSRAGAGREGPGRETGTKFSRPTGGHPYWIMPQRNELRSLQSKCQGPIARRSGKHANAFIDVRPALVGAVHGPPEISAGFADIDDCNAPVAIRP
jgi:hypothetical protein